MKYIIPYNNGIAISMQASLSLTQKRREEGLEAHL